jgi:hypothetical protein
MKNRNYGQGPDMLEFMRMMNPQNDTLLQNIVGQAGGGRVVPDLLKTIIGNESGEKNTGFEDMSKMMDVISNMLATIEVSRDSHDDSRQECHPCINSRQKCFFMGTLPSANNKNNTTKVIRCTIT